MAFGQDAKTAHLGVSPYSIFIDPQVRRFVTHDFFLVQGKWLLGGLGFSFSGVRDAVRPFCLSLGAMGTTHGLSLLLFTTRGWAVLKRNEVLRRLARSAMNRLRGECERWTVFSTKVLTLPL